LRVSFVRSVHPICQSGPSKCCLGRSPAFSRERSVLGRRAFPSDANASPCTNVPGDGTRGRPSD
jgi:hypothetical protein